MLFIALGVVIGLGIAFVPVPAIAGLVDAGVNALTETGHDAAIALLDLAPLDNHPKLAAAAAVVVGVLTPGVLVIGLATAIKITGKARKIVAVTIMAGAAASFAALPASHAVGLLAAAVVVAAVVHFASGLWLITPLTAVAVTLTVRHAAMIAKIDGDNSSATQLHDITQTGDPHLWAAVVTLVAIAPFCWIAYSLLADRG